MYQDILTNIGLTEKESELYELLLKLGPSTIKKPLLETEFKRGDLYNILYSLQDINLVEIKEQEHKKVYVPVHPLRLQEIIKEQETEVKKNSDNLENILPDLTSMFRLISGRPHQIP